MGKVSGKYVWGVILGDTIGIARRVVWVSNSVLYFLIQDFKSIKIIYFEAGSCHQRD